jgi:hypothetical protein
MMSPGGRARSSAAAGAEPLADGLFEHRDLFDPADVGGYRDARNGMEGVFVRFDLAPAFCKTRRTVYTAR